MIVKNESHIIVNTLKHLANYIKFDYWVISDTGSTDSTKEDIKNYFEEVGISGELIETPWKDFGYNRTVAMNHAYKKTDYLFVWDADDEIVGNFELPKILKEDSYKFIFGSPGGLRYSRCQLFNNMKKWHYVGVLHEYAAPLEPVQETVDVLGNYYFISGHKGDRSKDPNKYLKDALILEKAFNEKYAIKDPIYNRYCFYTAQSYSCCNQPLKAIEYYKKVLTLDNWIQEKYYSCLQIYELYDRLKCSEDGLIYLVEAFKYDKKRIECIYRLVKYYCIKEMPEVAFGYYTIIKSYYETNYLNDDISNYLFANKEEYDFYFPYYMIIVGERTKNYDSVIKMYEIIFKKNITNIGEWWINNLFNNIQFITPYLSKDVKFLELMLNYIISLRKRKIKLTDNNNKIVDLIIKNYKSFLTSPSEFIRTNIVSKKINIMFTITTCKRLELFKQTINSIKRTWKDLNLVDYFLCVDDNSSNEDRIEMQKLYPFFNYYMKTPEEKGHRESMNIIWNKLNELKPAYWIHMEDDWVYFKSNEFITKGIKLLDKYENQNIHQLVFNREYGLMMENINWYGNIMSGEEDIVLHEKRDNIAMRNCAYWPHYSLQPSITRTSTILELGNYDSANAFFERDYADKYYAKGYKTIFFDFIYCLHIGKQHWEKDGKNAYALNETGQFLKKIEPVNNKIVPVNNNIVPVNNELIEDKLNVIIVISNPCLFKKRYQLTREFINRIQMKEKRVELFVVELCYENQKFIITDSSNKNHLQLRGKDVLWHKENMINIGVKKLLPSNWKAMAWLDADIEFENYNWVSDTLKVLNGSKDIIQLWSQADNMDNDKSTINIPNSFGYQYAKGNKYSGIGVNFWHPGYAWACTRQAYEKMGGLYDKAILGSGDSIMALCLIKDGLRAIKDTSTFGYKKSIIEYQKNVEGLRFGYIPGVVRHYYHGTKENRKYTERWLILLKHEFDPYTFLDYNDDGLLVPTKACSYELIQEISNYFKERKEDD